MDGWRVFKVRPWLTIGQNLAYGWPMVFFEHIRVKSVMAIHGGLHVPPPHFFTPDPTTLHDYFADKTSNNILTSEPVHRVSVR